MSSLPIAPSSAKERRKQSGRQVPAADLAEYTIQEAAAKLGVAEQKLRRWDAQGVLVARRTDGGHRRYAREIVDGLAGHASAGFSASGSQSEELSRAHQDLKEKRRIIQLLVESESRYRDLVETSHDLIWTTDALGRFTYLNNGTIDIFGLEPSALIGRCFFDFESQPSHISNRRFLSTLRKHGEVKDYLTHLVAADGSDRWVGINARVWYDDDRIIGLRGTARNVTEQHRAALEIEFLATHDALTGLPNQFSLRRALEQALKTGASGALLCIDIDQFRRVREEHGHHAGDQAIIAVGAMLRDQFQERGATVFRYGADQFAVQLPEASENDAEMLAEEALRAFRLFTPKLPTSSQLLQLTVSIGIASYSSDEEDASTLLNKVERAVNKAKAEGRDRCVVHDARPGEDVRAVNHRARRKLELRKALDEDRLVLYSQPIISMTNPGSRHEELFARIVNNDGSVSEPRQFLGMAESVGLIQEIDLCVTRKLLEHLNREPAPRGTRFFVNLSPTSIADPYWLPRFYALLSKNAAECGKLVFEVSERAAMANVEMTKALFSRLKEAGCSCALDNFGTGFSSLYYLKQFDVDYLKVDGAFVRELASDPANSLFIRALAEVARGLNREIVAEWVETPEVLAKLKELGIEYAQGFYFGRPEPFSRAKTSKSARNKPYLPTVLEDTVEP